MSKALDGPLSSGQRVAVIIPARNEADRIAATVRVCRAIPLVDLMVVVDDGSTDGTQHAARAAGAVTVRHSVNRGKASAMETGSKVVAMRDPVDGPGRLLLFIDADLGESAANCAPLVQAVLEGEADCAIAALPPQQDAGGHGFVTGLARRAIQRITGWTPTQPLSGQRCLTHEAFFSVLPLAGGWGVETGMTIDLLLQGYTVQEVPCDLEHRATKNNFRGYLHRLGQYRDVWLAVQGRRFFRTGVKMRKPKRRIEHNPGDPYSMSVL
ncbi:MAG: glycosyltransferase family 2 protein [Actinomycetaceae bacterium]|nr:glycosyltransferase family 2 protein [Actinomycetaceae bacterium]